ATTDSGTASAGIQPRRDRIGDPAQPEHGHSNPGSDQASSRARQPRFDGALESALRTPMTPSQPAAVPGLRSYPPALERVLDDFEQAWENGKVPVLEQFLSRIPTDVKPSREYLENLVGIDLEYRWRLTLPAGAEKPLGLRPCLEAYVAHLPQLGGL